MTIKAIETSYKGCRFRSRLEARWAVFFDAIGLEWEYEPEGFDLGDGVWYLPDFKIFCGDDHKPAWFEVKGKKSTKSDIIKLEKLCRGTGMHGYIASGTMDVPVISIGRKGKVKYSGSIIIHRGPKEISLDDKKIEVAASTIENGAICAFYEDGEGRIEIDHVYLDDTRREDDLSKRGEHYYVTPKGSESAIDMVDALSNGGDRGFWVVDKILEDMTVVFGTLNSGTGRFFRSSLLKRAYQKARSARFEHGETPHV